MTNKYLTVTALTRYIKRKLDIDPHLRNVWLKGEISNFKLHSRGHMYLTLKDDQSRINAVMFAGNNRFLKFRPENGMKVLVRGEISVFEATGQYQLYIQQMEPDGIGSLYLAFEQLKEKLRKQGYFEESYKKEIPKVPDHIAVITSPTGAAVRDIITTIKRRYPVVQLTVLPVLVQGVNAARSIQKAIEQANAMSMFDVIILGRGGGSIEELWSFNEEIVADAIFRSQIPIISAVGHETDVTISDYVADLRAPTPTGAAEMAVPSQAELLDKIAKQKQSLTSLVSLTIKHHQSSLDQMIQSYAFRYPEQLIRQKELELDRYKERLERSTQHTVRNKMERYTSLKTRIYTQHPKKRLDEAVRSLNQLMKQSNQLMSQQIEKQSVQLNRALDKLTLLNPLEIMKRGFAIPYTSTGEIIKSSKQIEPKDVIELNLNDGVVNCEVLDVKECKNGTI
ncbi:exodeoxyribonuclease VII large subunit [Ornithinibacillus halotolerans]|uniref:Exodeoxyribonuclease 7 large subunit n=1 Tax=Ornithinibacillus halotolerans TaxID=1274357 RepID=A0A916RRR8_9BACI|nr:exodeoxyribonuclease VII large subunit [Ornithinibacillus halotolerans]GGA68055.1 exodeoxyribonuclease 7 large subunit [Ornithinibacillus halotolerans]